MLGPRTRLPKVLLGYGLAFTIKTTPEKLDKLRAYLHAHQGSVFPDLASSRLNAALMHGLGVGSGLWVPPVLSEFPALTPAWLGIQKLLGNERIVGIQYWSPEFGIPKEFLFVPVGELGLPYLGGLFVLNVVDAHGKTAHIVIPDPDENQVPVERRRVKVFVTH